MTQESFATLQSFFPSSCSLRTLSPYPRAPLCSVSLPRRCARPKSCARLPKAAPPCLTKRAREGEGRGSSSQPVLGARSRARCFARCCKSSLHMSGASHATLLPLSNESAFALLNGVLVGWVLLFLAPRWRYTPSATLAIGVGYTVVYTVLVLEAALPGAAPLPEGAGFGTLEAVQKLFAAPRAVLGGWTHYVAYDLLVARGCVLDALARGIPRLLWTATLPLLLMVGPAGLLAYVAIAAAYPYQEKPHWRQRQR